MRSPGIFGKLSWGYLPQDSKLKDKLSKIIGHPHPYGRLRAMDVMPHINEHLKTLDAGCGEGVFSRELRSKGVDVSGVDISEDAILACKNNMKRLNIEYTVCEGNLESLKFEDNSFDQIISTDVIEHVNDPEKALLELNRILKPGGRFIMTVPTPLYLTKSIISFNFKPHLEEIGHVNEGWFFEEGKELLNRCGFKVVKGSYYGHGPIRLIMEILYAIAGKDGIEKGRAGLYKIKYTALLAYLFTSPFLWLDRFFSRKKKGAFLTICSIKDAA